MQSPDQDGTKVVDVGQGGSGHDELVEPRKVPVGVVVRQERGGVQGRVGGRGAAMVEPGACVVLDPVDSIGVAGEGGNVGEIRQCEVKGQEELGIPATATLPRTVTVVSPPERRTHGLIAGMS